MNERNRTTWVINGLLAAILVLLAGHYLNVLSPPAYAAGGGWETDGVIATSVLDAERLVLIDTKNKTICVYKTTGNMFRLVGARSYEYDIEVIDSAPPRKGQAAILPIEHGNGVTWMEMYNIYKTHIQKRP
jgi:hypothetical protein